MEKKVLLKELVDSGTHLRKQITSKVRVSDEGLYPIGEIWDANTVVDVIVNGAHDQHDTLRELDQMAHNTQSELQAEILRANEAEQQILENKADKDTTYTKSEIDSMIGNNVQVVDNYAIYSFSSYSQDGFVPYGTGKAQLTGVTSGEYTQIVVIENVLLGEEDRFVGQKFYISSDANPDGETLYQLYDDDKNLVGIGVKIQLYSETTYKDASLVEYIQFLVNNSVANIQANGGLTNDSVGSEHIIDGSINIQDLSDEVKDKLYATVDEEEENANFN